MVRRRGTPELGEYVICTVMRVNPNSAFAKLEEYQNKEGMIHISEISSGWVRDIRKFVKEGQRIVAKVMGIDPEKNAVSLSLKRVEKNAENRKLKEFNMSGRSEKMLELIAKSLGKNLNDAYEEVGYVMQEQFGSLYDGFKVAATQPSLLKERGIPEIWIAPLHEIAEKNIDQKEHVFRAKLTLRSVKPDGLQEIKAFLEKQQKPHVDFSYIAAPQYLIRFKTKNPKKGEKEFQKMLDEMIEHGKKYFEIAAERL
ncbi:MAG: S1 RNA-binding domain-containing protein [Candidatus Aenigmarchaeota archaeon]|nr:S1 RNA-binding domain-containing protein [Candidatus Aenigmarchaeota archaeon]